MPKHVSAPHGPEREGPARANATIDAGSEHVPIASSTSSRRPFGWIIAGALFGALLGDESAQERSAWHRSRRERAAAALNAAERAGLFALVGSDQTSAGAVSALARVLRRKVRASEWQARPLQEWVDIDGLTGEQKKGITDGIKNAVFDNLKYTDIEESYDDMLTRLAKII